MRACSVTSALAEGLALVLLSPPRQPHDAGPEVLGHGCVEFGDVSHHRSVRISDHLEDVLRLLAARTWRTDTWSAQPVRPDAVRRSSILVSATCWERAGRSSRMRPVRSSKTGCTPSRSAAQPARRGTLPLALRRSMLSTVPTRRTCAPHRAAEAATVSRSAPACAARAAASTTRPCPPNAVPVSATRTGTLALRDAWSAA